VCPFLPRKRWASSTCKLINLTLCSKRKGKGALSEQSMSGTGPDGGGVSIQLGASFLSRQTESGTSAAKAGFFISFTAGLKACSTP
jgi:hypothetical protein